MKNKTKQKSEELFFRAHKPILSAQLEAVTEYCRIVFDLFPVASKPTREEIKQQSQIGVIIPQIEPPTSSSSRQTNQKNWNG